MPTHPHARPWLARFAALTAVATLGLIGLGGLVTSHGVGMAVPDWPTTFGYNMFLFPVSQWVGGVFYEHTHRLYASVVGLMTLILAIWLQARAIDRRLARFGWLALALVSLQGLLGGLRVNLMLDNIGIVHAFLAQCCLVLMALLAVWTSSWWQRWRTQAPTVGPGASRWLGVTSVLILAQLLVGATMRHQHAGLAVPDFPLAYGQGWPRTDDAFLQTVNALRTDVRDFQPITAFQIQLHMAHRILAVLATILIGISALKLRRAFGPGSTPARLGQVWIGLIALQVLLGAATVWSNKAADIATAHVVIGACTLVTGVIGIALSHPVRRRNPVARDARLVPSAVFAGAEAS